LEEEIRERKRRRIMRRAAEFKDFDLKWVWSWICKNFLN
jgi:hypothetical protein